MTTRDELVVGLADELARDAATYAAGTPTRKLLHRAADALRLASRQEASVEELAKLIDPQIVPEIPGIEWAEFALAQREVARDKARALLAKYSITNRTE